MRWAKRYETPKVNAYTVRMNESLDILEFKEMTEEWLDFIIDCRHYDNPQNILNAYLYGEVE